MGPSIGQVLSWWAGGRAENPLGGSCKVQYWDPESNHYTSVLHNLVGVGSGGRRPKIQHEHTPLELGDATALNEISSPWGRASGTLGKSLTHLEPLFPHLENGYHPNSLWKALGAMPGSGA